MGIWNAYHLIKDYEPEISPSGLTTFDHFSGKNHGKTLQNVKLMKLMLPQVAGHEGLEEEPNRRFQVGSGAVVVFLRSIT